jgi:hypothetical protein
MPKSNRVRRGRRIGRPFRTITVAHAINKLPPKVRRWVAWFKWCELTNTRVKSNDPRYR